MPTRIIRKSNHKGHSSCQNDFHSGSQATSWKFANFNTIAFPNIVHREVYDLTSDEDNCDLFDTFVYVTIIWMLWMNILLNLDLLVLMLYFQKMIWLQYTIKRCYTNSLWNVKLNMHD